MYFTANRLSVSQTPIEPSAAAAAIFEPSGLKEKDFSATPTSIVPILKWLEMLKRSIWPVKVLAASRVPLALNARTPLP